MVATKNAPQQNTRQVLATKMKVLRSELGLSQEELSFECELHRAFIAHMNYSHQAFSLEGVSNNTWTVPALDY